MKTRLLIILLFAIASSVYAFNRFSSQNQQEPWTPQQLLNPADLAETLNNPKANQPIVFSVGPQAVIKGSIDIGSTMMKANLNKLKLQLDKLPKNSQIVVYCGCCPFDRCPNIRPAIALLKDMQFNNYKLLNLTQNIKVNWIDLGYPLSE